MSTPAQRNQVIADAMSRMPNAPMSQPTQNWGTQVQGSPVQMPQIPQQFTSNYTPLNLGPNVRPMFQGFKPKE